MRAIEPLQSTYGFRVRVFNLIDYHNPAELDRILYARGYRALMLGFWFTDKPRIFEMKLQCYAHLLVAPHHTYRPDGVRAAHEATAHRALLEINRLLRTGTLGADPAMGEILLEPEWVAGRTLGAEVG